MVRSAQVHPEFDNREDSEGSVRSGHLKAIGALASIRERWGEGRKGGDMDPPSPRCAARPDRYNWKEGGIPNGSEEGDRVSDGHRDRRR